jgi:tRNA-specific 2-thiouridylase
VKEIRADSNEVVIADEEALFRTVITCRDVNYMSVAEMKPGERLRGTVKVRYHHAGQAAEIDALGGGRVRITFDEAVRAPAPGQSAVFYDEEDCVIGGGIIEKA